MVLVEAAIPELSQIAAVYTIKGYRGRGLAKGVVSSICKDQLLDKPRVTLTVKTDNVPAFRVYRALGFRRWTDYRMSRFA
jgi:predicted GNAT family acetyltransferase